MNEEWLDGAREVLQTDTKVATVNAALHALALRKEAMEIVAALDAVPMDFAESAEGGGHRPAHRMGRRDL